MRILLPLRSKVQERRQRMKYLKFAQLQEKLGGRGRTTIYQDIKLGRLPRPKKLGGKNYWLESEIDAAMGVAPDLSATEGLTA